CRSCTSTATRSRTRRCSPGYPMASSPPCSRGTGTACMWWPATSPRGGARGMGGAAPGREGVPRRLAATLNEVVEEIRSIQRRAREDGDLTRPTWPAIVLATPKGWTGPKTVDGLSVEGTWRAHQVPITDARGNPEHLAELEQWLRSYRPE